jgi:type IV secretory pathway TrbD component
MRYCRECGSSDVSRFCAGCGARAESGQAPSPQVDAHSAGLGDRDANPQWETPLPRGESRDDLDGATALIGAAYPSAPALAQVSKTDLWMARIERATSIRLLFMCIILATLCGALAGAIWEPISSPVAVIVGIGGWLAAVCNDEQMAKCDVCRKRVKFGATACHHCGYSRNQF